MPALVMTETAITRSRIDKTFADTFFNITS